MFICCSALFNRSNGILKRMQLMEAILPHIRYAILHILNTSYQMTVVFSMGTVVSLNKVQGKTGEARKSGGRLKVSLYRSLFIVIHESDLQHSFNITGRLNKWTVLISGRFFSCRVSNMKKRFGRAAVEINLGSIHKMNGCRAGGILGPPLKDKVKSNYFMACNINRNHALDCLIHSHFASIFVQEIEIYL